MDLLSLKRGVLPMRGYRNEDGDGGAGGSMSSSDQSSGPGGTSSSGGYDGGSGGYDGGYNSDSYGGDLGGYNYGNSYGGYAGPPSGWSASYATPDLSDVTNTPKSGLSPADQATVASVRDAVDRGVISKAALDRAIAGFPDKGASVLGFIGGMLAGPLGSVAGRAIGKALSSQDPMSALRSLDAQAQSMGLGGTYGSLQGDGGPGAGGIYTAGGPTLGQGASPAAPAGPLDDIFSQFTGTTDSYTAPAYDPDPSGLVAGGKQSMTDYNTLYKPYAQKMMAEVDRLGTPEYLAQQRSMAMADQQSQYDNTMQQNMRGLSRMGVNPSSGRMLAMQNQGAISNASAKVAAAAKAEGMVRSNYQSGLTAVNSMGMDVAKMGQGWANLGNDAAKTQNMWGLGASELGLKARTSANDTALNWGKLAVDRYGIDKGVQRTQMTNDAQADRDKDSNLWGLAGLGLQSWFS